MIRQKGGITLGNNRYDTFVKQTAKVSSSRWGSTGLSLFLQNDSATGVEGIKAKGGIGNAYFSVKYRSLIPGELAFLQM